MSKEPDYFTNGMAFGFFITGLFTFILSLFFPVVPRSYVYEAVIHQKDYTLVKYSPECTAVFKGDKKVYDNC